MKVNLILQPDQFTSFTSWYLEPLWREYFDIEVYNADKIYSKRSLFAIWGMNANDPITQQLATDGHHVVLDNLWEKYNPNFGQYYQLTNPNWWWYNESLWWRALGYDQYVPNKTYQYTALMPVRQVKAVRDWIIENLSTLKDQMLWSYKDHVLPNDSGDQRFMHPDWYNDTTISLVIESLQTGTRCPVTEKSYKPCAFYHPFLIVGQSGALSFLKSQGFETFGNLFNESYDSELNFEKRFSIIVDNLNKFTQGPYSALTLEKLKHNHNHFFDQALCRQRIIKEIIEPLIHYAET